ncbi:MAG: hypothetical protein AAF802_32915, partial [Planctomycetota bacterium]
MSYTPVALTPRVAIAELHILTQRTNKPTGGPLVLQTFFEHFIELGLLDDLRDDAGTDGSSTFANRE